MYLESRPLPVWGSISRRPSESLIVPLVAGQQPLEGRERNKDSVGSFLRASPGGAIHHISLHPLSFSVTLLHPATRRLGKVVKICAQQGNGNSMENNYPVSAISTKV